MDSRGALDVYTRLVFPTRLYTDTAARGQGAPQDLPSWFSISATSSLPTLPSLSLSSIWKPSRSVLTCDGCSCDRLFPCPRAEAPEVVVDDRAGPLAATGAPEPSLPKPRGVLLPVVEVGVAALAPYFELTDTCGPLAGDPVGVDCLSGDGETGD